MMQALPFSAAKLDALLDQSGADALLASSKHNVQYLLGGYRYFFFEHSAAIGLGHYLPVMGYVKGREYLAFYVGGGDEGWGIEVFPIWPERIATVSWDARESARVAAEFLKSAGLVAPRIALEFELWPVAAWEILRTELPAATFIDATEILEELRAVKTEVELNHLRNAARIAIQPGALGSEIYETALHTLKSCSHQNDMRFVAHGIGLIAHEAPRLTATGPIPYSDKHASRPLEAGMVISIETHVKHPDVGFVKLEDTVAVTDSGWEAFGDWGRGWNVLNGTYSQPVSQS
jgi:Xaa-Pro aminopeptidase